MYDILSRFLEPNQIAVAGILAAFVLTFAGLAFPFPFLPVDHGREFAVNGNLSKDKRCRLCICNSIYNMFTVIYACQQGIHNILYIIACSNA